MARLRDLSDPAQAADAFTDAGDIALDVLIGPVETVNVAVAKRMRKNALLGLILLLVVVGVVIMRRRANGPSTPPPPEPPAPAGVPVRT